MRLGSFVSVAFCLLFLGCRPPHVVVFVQDPDNLADDALLLAIAAADGSEEFVPLPESGGIGEQRSVTIVGDRVGERLLHLRALVEEGARARAEAWVIATLSSEGGQAIARLAPTCDALSDDGQACSRPGGEGVGLCFSGACAAEDCGDGVVSGTEECDDEGDVSLSCAYGEAACVVCSATCTLVEGAVHRCGDDVLDEAEECDDGTANDDGAAHDGCRTDCIRPTCGDGVGGDDEACDEGALNVANEEALGGDCRTDCSLARCGDGLLDADEACDEGALNVAPGAATAGACRDDCIIASCGDGILDVDEACDEGALNVAYPEATGGACRLDCTVASCGDNVRDADEECDDGDGNDDSAPYDGCRSDCRQPSCGDGFVAASDEECEPDGDLSCDYGELSCARCDLAKCVFGAGATSYCGDGFVDSSALEECDDGQDVPTDFDGCSATCSLTVWSTQLDAPIESGAVLLQTVSHPDVSGLVEITEESIRSAFSVFPPMADDLMVVTAGSAPALSVLSSRTGVPRWSYPLSALVEGSVLWTGEVFLVATRDGRVHAIAPPASPDDALDAGTVDAGTVDAGALDAGTVDAGTVDAGTVDAGALDAGAGDGVPQPTATVTQMPDGFVPASGLLGRSTPPFGKRYAVLGEDKKLYLLSPTSETPELIVLFDVAAACPECALCHDDGCQPSATQQAFAHIFLPLRGAIVLWGAEDCVVRFDLEPEEYVLGRVAFLGNGDLAIDENDLAVAVTSAGRVLQINLKNLTIPGGNTDCGWPEAPGGMPEDPRVGTVRAFDVPIDSDAGPAPRATATPIILPLSGSTFVVPFDDGVIRRGRAVSTALEALYESQHGDFHTAGALDGEGFLYFLDDAHTLHKLSVVTGITPFLPFALEGVLAPSTGSPLVIGGGVFVSFEDGQVRAMERGGTAPPLNGAWSRDIANAAGTSATSCATSPGAAPAFAAFLLLVLCCRRRRAGAGLLSVLLIVTPVVAAAAEEKQTPDELIAEAQREYDGLAYDVVISLAESALAHEDITVEQELEAYLLLGVSLAVVGESVDAEKPFRFLLRQRPDFDLPEETPPKIMAVFRKVQVEERAIREQTREFERKQLIERIELTQETLDEVKGGHPVRFDMRVRDPRGAVVSVSAQYRWRGEAAFSSLALRDAESGRWHGELPGSFTESEQDRVLEYFVVTYDEDGLPLRTLGEAAAPQALAVSSGTLADAVPFYETVWFWSAIAVVGVTAIGVAVASGAAGVIASLPPQSELPTAYVD